MDAATELKILAHVQYVTRHYQAFKGTLDTIVAFVAYSLGPAAPPPDEITRLLRQDRIQRTLEANYETSLFQATDKSWRLICLAPVVNIEQARRRHAEWPVSKATQCAWCLQDEKNFAAMELKPLLDIKRNPVSGRYVHRACARPYQQMIDMAEREEQP